MAKKNTAATTANTNDPKPQNSGAKIIPFPKHKIVREHPASPQAFKKALKNHKLVFVNEVVDDYTTLLYNNLQQAGVSIDEESTQFKTDFYFVCAALKSALLRHYGIKHQLQGFVDEHFVYDATDESYHVTYDKLSEEDVVELIPEE